MLERQLAAESERAEALLGKLKAGYSAAKQDKLARKAEEVRMQSGMGAARNRGIREGPCRLPVARNEAERRRQLHFASRCVQGRGWCSCAVM